MDKKENLSHHESVHIGYVADKTPVAQKALLELQLRYKLVDMTHEIHPKVTILIILGGDGFMLHTLHRFMHHSHIAFYGMNCGTVGFLMNNFSLERLIERIKGAKKVMLRPLHMEALCREGKKHTALAVNEVSLFRKTNQAAHVRVSVNGTVRVEEMVGDGLLVATPGGSTAYNFSVGGPILPLTSNILTMMPISPFRPRRWKGALLPYNVKLEIEVLQPEKRPVNAIADFHEVPYVLHVKIRKSNSVSIQLLFDADHSLEERILQEQFMP